MSRNTLRCVQYLDAVRLQDGGVVRCVLDLCKLLASRGHEVTLMTPDAQDAPAAWLGQSPGIPRITGLAPLRSPVHSLNKTARRDALEIFRLADVVHLHGVWSVANLQLARLASKAGTPYVVSTHGMLDDWSMAQKRAKKRLFHGLVGSRFLRRAACLHFTASGERSQVRRWVEHTNGCVIPTPLDLDPYLHLPGTELAATQFALPSDGLLKLLFMSRLHPKKGLEQLLNAVPRLNDAGTRCRVVVAGSGEPAYETSLRRLATDLGIEQQVSFVGFVSGVAKVSLLEACDIFVLPTSQENFGMVLFEALAAAMPVITTKGVDVWDELQSAGAQIVDPEPSELADAILRWVTAPERLGVIGLGSRRWVFEHLNAEKVVAGYEDLYRRAVKTRDDALG